MADNLLDNGMCPVPCADSVVLSGCCTVGPLSYFTSVNISWSLGRMKWPLAPLSPFAMIHCFLYEGELQVVLVLLLFINRFTPTRSPFHEVLGQNALDPPILSSNVAVVWCPGARARQIAE